MPNPVPPSRSVRQLDALQALGWWLWGRAGTPTERIDDEHATKLVAEIAQEVRDRLGEIETEVGG